MSFEAVVKPNTRDISSIIRHLYRIFEATMHTHAKYSLFSVLFSALEQYEANVKRGGMFKIRAKKNYGWCDVIFLEDFLLETDIHIHNTHEY